MARIKGAIRTISNTCTVVHILLFSDVIFLYFSLTLFFSNTFPLYYSDFKESDHPLITLYMCTNLLRNMNIDTRLAQTYVRFSMTC